jgi:hypothetical protein
MVGRRRWLIIALIPARYADDVLPPWEPRIT